MFGARYKQVQGDDNDLLSRAEPERGDGRYTGDVSGDRGGVQIPGTIFDNTQRFPFNTEENLKIHPSELLLESRNLLTTFDCACVTNACVLR